MLNLCSLRAESHKRYIMTGLYWMCPASLDGFVFL